MFIQIDMQSKVPIYQQLKTAIIEGILSGDLKEGDSLPSVRQLGVELGINLHTVNKAYNLLKDDGYIMVHRSKGAVITGKSVVSENFLEQLKNELIPIVIEAKGKDLSREKFNEIIDSIWN